MVVARSFAGMAGAALAMLPLVALPNNAGMDKVANDIAARVPTHCNPEVDAGRNAAEARREKGYAGNAGLVAVLRTATGATATLMTEFNAQGGSICHSSLLNGPERSGVALVYGETPTLVLSTNHKTPSQMLFNIGTALGQARTVNSAAAAEKISLEGKVLEPGPWAHRYQPQEDVAVRALSGLAGSTARSGLPVSPPRLQLAAN
jgi:hypothetical protein